jgi:cell division protein FtsA
VHNNEIYVSLDIGTSTVKVIIGEMENDSLNIIGVGNAASEGLKKGQIVDIDETVKSIRKAVEQAERMVGMEIRKVIVGISANHIMLQPCHGVVAVSNDNREITEEDKTRVREQAELVTIPSDREIIDVIPVHYKVDEIDEISDPKGMTGVRLEMRGVLITGLRTILHNTLRAVERAGLEITDIALQPMAAGSLVLSKDERNLGIALVDIGGGSTQVAVFEDGELKGATVIPLGGNNITKDISIVLKTPTDVSEQIKVRHGHAFIDDDAEEETFTVPVIGSEKQQTCNQFIVSDIMEDRLTEIFEMVEDAIVNMGVTDLLGGYVLTGGVVKTPGILDLAQNILQNRVRGAEPNYIGVREPQYTTSVGLITYACNKARSQGLKLGAHTVAATRETTEKRPAQKPAPKEKAPKNPEDKVSTKMKKFFGVFFE